MILWTPLSVKKFREHPDTSMRPGRRAETEVGSFRPPPDLSHRLRVNVRCWWLKMRVDRKYACIKLIFAPLGVVPLADGRFDWSFPFFSRMVQNEVLFRKIDGLAAETRNPGRRGQI